MNSIEAIILGIVQGLTEFLPVSSSGHLVMAQSLMGVAPDGGIVFEVAVHVATLVAILLFYFKRVTGLTLGALTGDGDSWRYIGKLAVATLPAIAIALTLKEFIENQFNAPAVAGAMLLVTGCIVWTTRYTITKGEELEPTWSQAFIIGCAQAFAILPGITRSGTTLATAMALGMAPMVANILVGGSAALVSGLLALVAFVWLLKSKRFHVFAWYAWAAGTAFLIWLGMF